MPTYDYRCEKCDHVFELFHGMTETPEIECPECGHDKAEKQVGVGLIKTDKPAWDTSEEIKRYINKMQPKRIRDDKAGVNKKFPKGGV